MTKPNLQGQGGQRAAWIGLQVESHRKGDFAWICACPRCVGLRAEGAEREAATAHDLAETHHERSVALSRQMDRHTHAHCHRCASTLSPEVERYHGLAR